MLRDGGVVAFPTETVYGLGADAENADAVRRVFAIKGRPAGHPVIVHLGDVAQLERWASEIPPAAKVLAQRFWPGPLTLVLARTDRATDAVTGGQPTVALRVPAHPVAQRILNGFGGGVIAPSANRFGHVSATTAAHVEADLGDAVDLIVDGGPATMGIESTIVDLAHGPPALLRPGGVTLEELEAALGARVRANGAPDVRAPGTLPSHYAPRAKVELVGDAAAAGARAEELRAQGRRVAIVQPLAAELYARLRDADRDGAEIVVAILPEQTGIGRAVADRLRRAAGRP